MNHPSPAAAGARALLAFRTLLQRSLQPPPGENSVAFWRQRIMDLMLSAGAILGLPVWLASVLLSLRERLWSVALVDSLAYGWIVAAVLSPGWSYLARVRGMLVVFYGISVVVLVRLGNDGGGMIWLAALPVLAALLIGLRAALACWLLALVTLVICGWAMTFGHIGGDPRTGGQAISLAAWGVVSVNALFLSALLALPTAILLRGLEFANEALAREERQRARLENELRHAQKLESLGRLAGGVAHDMNNILVGILGLSSALAEQHAGNAALARSLGIIQSAGERGRKLVKGLTDFARKGLEDALPVDLNALVRGELELLRTTLPARIELGTELAEGLPKVLGEAASLGNALMNLCVNAIDAMPEGGRLTLTTRTGGNGWVELEVRDSGQGMSREVLERATEPFFTTKPAGKGTGLGLAMVYGTLKAHGGGVELASEVGQGTRVRLCFPVPAHGDSAPAGPCSALPEVGPAARRVLVVDDDPLIQETLATALAALAERVHSAGHGQQALDLLAAGLDVDLVILDQNMPGLTGAETLVRLRALRPELPVILSTGFLESMVEEQVRAVPGVWLLGKPYPLAALRTLIQAIPGNR